MRTIGMGQYQEAWAYVGEGTETPKQFVKRLDRMLPSDRDRLLQRAQGLAEAAKQRNRGDNQPLHQSNA